MNRRWVHLYCYIWHADKCHAEAASICYYHSFSGLILYHSTFWGQAHLLTICCLSEIRFKNIFTVWTGLWTILVLILRKNETKISQPILSRLWKKVIQGWIYSEYKCSQSELHHCFSLGRSLHLTVVTDTLSMASFTGGTELGLKSLLNFQIYHLAIIVSKKQWCIWSKQLIFLMIRPNKYCIFDLKKTLFQN